jgi:hypothetical protein
MPPTETGQAAARLEYQVFNAKRPGLSRDVPPGYESLMWVSNSATLIFGKRDAVLVDTSLTIDHGVKLADEIAATGKNLLHHITHGPVTTSSASTRSSTGSRTSGRWQRPPSSTACAASSSPR